MEGHTCVLRTLPNGPGEDITYSWKKFASQIFKDLKEKVM